MRRTTFICGSRLAVFCLLALAPSVSVLGQGVGSIAPPKQYAFLVACAEYDRRELKPLAYTIEDVKELYNVLLASGIPAENVVLMHDRQPRDLLPEARKVREQFDLLLARIGPNDSVVVALSGHGVQFEGKKSNFFCPLDARLQDPQTLIPLDDIYRQLDECPARQKLLLVDACRNDPQSSLGRSRSVVELKTLSRPQELDVPQGIVALFSCSAGQQSYEHPDLKHGVFFYHLLQGWKGAADANRDRRLTLDELLNYTKDKTEAFAHLKLKATQIPHLKGDFSGVWSLRELPLRFATPAGKWQVTEAVNLNGNPYGGTVNVSMTPTGVASLAWYNRSGQHVQNGLGFLQDGHLMAVWSAEPTYGINLYKIQKDGTLNGRWTVNVSQGRVGAELASGGTPGVLEGEYQVRGTSTAEDGGGYSGTMKINRHGETYYVAWNASGYIYYGIGLRHGDWLAVGWGLKDLRHFGVVDYAVQDTTAAGRWTMLGSQKVSFENLERLGQ